MDFIFPKWFWVFPIENFRIKINETSNIVMHYYHSWCYLRLYISAFISTTSGYKKTLQGVSQIPNTMPERPSTTYFWDTLWRSNQYEVGHWQASLPAWTPTCNYWQYVNLLSLVACCFSLIAAWVLMKQISERLTRRLLSLHHTLLRIYMCCTWWIFSRRQSRNLQHLQKKPTQRHIF